MQKLFGHAKMVSKLLAMKEGMNGLEWSMLTMN
jgi:hypothetical protein